MSNDIFDFGFTAVDEDELEAVQTATKKAESVTGTAQVTQTKLDKLYNAIIPLLNNLKKNPQKEYILWPDRLAKVEAFEDHFFNDNGKNINIMFNSLVAILLSNDYQKRKTNNLSHEEYANKIKAATLFRANSNKFELPRLIKT